ncbi:ABC-2 type transporter family protein [Striga asiatica]|uniref:ABC-2 type transporter family protein n=1 Tax=Striga asiatica TaxID=4170 RepID=A0A5A7PY38_STRAF|nr:ABC-2 type transporter family protein [Striga asiatica]
MERTEPALAPEWLRCSGNAAGGSTSVHHKDVSSSAHSTQSRYLRSNSKKDSPRYLDRNWSSSSRHSASSNGSTKHPYSSFSRSRWDKNRDREKEKSLSRDIWDHDSSDPLPSILTSRVEKGGLSRSKSLVSRKPGEPLPRRADDSRVSGNGVLSAGSNHSTNQKAVFDKDFPTLVTEEKQNVSGIKRVLSPGLSSAVQNLPLGHSGFLNGEKWTSALVEVPAVLASNGMGQSSLTQTAGLNMAEALSQPTARVHANPLQHDKTQRLEELAIKQSRQLIPMKPSMPKPLVPSSIDKSKHPKASGKNNETILSKLVHPQPHSSQLPNQSHAGQIKPDSASTSHASKFIVLKPGREVAPLGGKDGLSNGSNGRVINDSQINIAPPKSSTALISKSVASALENNAAALTISSRSTVDKKSAQSLAQSRSEFFKLMRRKASSSSSGSTSCSDSNSGILPSTKETCIEKCKEDNGDTRSSCALENDCEKKGFLDDGDCSLSGNGSIYPDEEEAAFLRSLGWDENGGEDEGLTEEEINAFYRENRVEVPNPNAQHYRHQMPFQEFLFPTRVPLNLSLKLDDFQKWLQRVIWFSFGLYTATPAIPVQAEGPDSTRASCINRPTEAANETNDTTYAMKSQSFNLHTQKL